MKKVWVVVANSSQAKVYRAENIQTLIEHGIFFHDESRLPNRELSSDGYGSEKNSMMSDGDTYEQKTSPKLKESQIFADTLADFLKKGCMKGEYEKLYVIAKPPFLGRLRQSLDPHVSKLIESEISKDLTHMGAHEIRDYLPPVL